MTEVSMMMNRRPVVYVCHQYGGDQLNRVAAAKWVAFFARHGFAPSATWIVITGEWDETMRDAGLEIDCEHVRRSDCVVACGPRLSGGMLVESSHGDYHGIPVVDATVEFPPTPDELTNEQAERLVKLVCAACCEHTGF